MSQTLRFVVFSLDEQRYAFALDVVERVVRAAQVTPLPRAPELVLGVINIQGTIVPVINLRRRNSLPERKLGLDDLFVIARAGQRSVALVVDEVCGVIECEERDIRPAEEMMPGIEFVTGALKSPQGIVLVQDLEAALSIHESHVLEGALQTEGAEAIH